MFGFLPLSIIYQWVLVLVLVLVLLVVFFCVVIVVVSLMMVVLVDINSNITTTTTSLNKDRCIQQISLIIFFYVLVLNTKFITKSTTIRITTTRFVLVVVKVNKTVGVISVETEILLSLDIVHSAIY